MILVEIRVKLFADDVKLYVQILDDTDMQRLQLAVDALVCWAEEWQLSISVNKRCILHVGKIVCKTDVCISANSLPVVDVTRDLGVTVASDLSPSVHATNTVAKTHKRAAAILRAFTFRDRKLLLRAFLVYVRAVVECNSIIWSPSTIRDIDAVESVQRHFTKQLPGLSHLPYSERLKCLSTPSLELRRLHTDLFWCYKIVAVLLISNVMSFFVYSPCVNTCGHKFKLYKHHSPAGVRTNFFSERVYNISNCLPEGVGNGFVKGRDKG